MMALTDLLVRFGVLFVIYVVPLLLGAIAGAAAENYAVSALVTMFVFMANVQLITYALEKVGDEEGEDS